MEHPVDPQNASPERGVTLLELLLVVAVLSVLLVGLGLSTGRGANPMQNDRTRFEEQFNIARMLAVQGGLRHGVMIEADGLRHADFGTDGWRISDTLLRWRGRIAHRVVQGGGGLGEPTLVFLPNGQTTAFIISFEDGRGITQCSSDGWAGLVCQGG